MTAPAGVTYTGHRRCRPAGRPRSWRTPTNCPGSRTPTSSRPSRRPASRTVGADASKAYPDPPDDQFGLGATYSGATYAAGQPFVDGTAQVAPRHPINVFYNAATNAQELDEYNTLYDSSCAGLPVPDHLGDHLLDDAVHFPQVINQVVAGMFQNMLVQQPRVSYVHQTNLMGTPPYSSICRRPTTSRRASAARHTPAPRH